MWRNRITNNSIWRVFDSINHYDCVKKLYTSNLKSILDLWLQMILFKRLPTKHYSETESCKKTPNFSISLIRSLLKCDTNPLVCLAYRTRCSFIQSARLLYAPSEWWSKVTLQLPCSLTYLRNSSILISHSYFMRARYNEFEDWTRSV